MVHWIWWIPAMILATIGAGLLLLAAVGMLRMPDMYMRMQTASKASTLGAGCVLLAAAILSSDGATSVRAVLAVVFLMMTTPIAAHLIARAAYRKKVAFSDETKMLDPLPDED